MRDWDQKLWSMGTNPLVIAAVALLQMRQVALMLRGGAPVEQVLIVQWFIPLACTICLAALVAVWGYRNFWSLTRTVLVGVSVVMLANPLVKAYVAMLSDLG